MMSMKEPRAIRIIPSAIAALWLLALGGASMGVGSSAGGRVIDPHFPTVLYLPSAVSLPGLYMPKDIKVLLDDRPGALAAVAEALGAAGINIDGICGFACDRKVGEDREFVTHFTHILVDDATVARKVLKAAKVDVVGETDVIVPDVRDAPGELARVCRKLGDAEVNIDFFYTASKNRVVLGVNDLPKARRVLGSA